MTTGQNLELQYLLDVSIWNSVNGRICCSADSCDGPVPAQPASAAPHLSDEVETHHGQGHSEAPSGAHLQQQGESTAAVPNVSQVTAQTPAVEPSAPRQAPAAPAAVQSKSPPLLVGPVQSTAVSPVDGQGGASGSAQPAQEQEQPAPASADSHAKAQVLDMLPVQEPAADSSHQLGNEALVSNAAMVEAAHSSQPAGSVQGSHATEAGGSVARVVAAEAERGGSNLHQGSARSEGGVPTQSAIHLPGCGKDGSVVQADLLQRYALTQPLCLPQ